MERREPRGWQGARGCRDKEGISGVTYGLSRLWTQPFGAGVREIFMIGKQTLLVHPGGHPVAWLGAPNPGLAFWKPEGQG